MEFSDSRSLTPDSYFLSPTGISLRSRVTRLSEVMPSERAAKFGMTRCLRMGTQTAWMSSMATWQRPRSAARDLPARMRFSEARGPAPHAMNFFTNSGASGSSGRVARTRAAACARAGVWGVGGGG